MSNHFTYYLEIKRADILITAEIWTLVTLSTSIIDISLFECSKQTIHMLLKNIIFIEDQ
jgi:hypothetical protein